MGTARMYDPDLLFFGGRVVTVDGDFSIAEALAVRDGRIVAVGDSDEVRALAGAATRVIDLQGGSVMPGINDSHLHLSWYGLSRPPYSVDLAARSLTDVRALVAERARSVGAESWIRGGGWDERRLSESGGPFEPTAANLDDVSNGRPTVLEHWTHHAIWANSEALRRAGITRDTPDPEGGRIVRSESGEPTGHLIETATDLVRRVVPEPSAAERREAIVAATRELSRRGVTSVTDPVVGPELLRDYVALRTSSALSVRVSALLHWDWPSVASSMEGLRRALGYAGLGSGLGDNWLRIGGCKLFADGVPGLGTAWTSRPTLRGETGALVAAGDTDERRRDELLDMIELLHRHRFQVQVHATGDLACEAVVDGFERALQRDPWPAARHVVIHANFVSEEAAQRLASNGLVCNVNSLIKWQASDALRDVLEDDRWHGNMPWGSLVRAGVHVADSSDAPITDPDWRQALETLVLRECRGSGTVSGADERLGRADAIRAWTIEAAYQEGLENTKGSLEVGKLADLVVLAEDVLHVDAHALHELTPVMTVLDGRVVHEL